MFAAIRQFVQLQDIAGVNTINTWAETQNARGLTPNRAANSNEMPGINSCAPAYSGVRSGGKLSQAPSQKEKTPLPRSPTIHSRALLHIGRAAAE
mmetsp:Transcript_58748/g.86132  ORF Transcript_58748/g.86132 Transcript_58748/m.86132 type:complete len:95 (+) Transcript_58748:152-436(+)